MRLGGDSDSAGSAHAPVDDLCLARPIDSRPAADSDYSRSVRSAALAVVLDAAPDAVPGPAPAVVLSAVSVGGFVDLRARP